LCVLALLAIVAIAGGDFNDTDGRILGTLLSIVIYSSTSFAHVPLIERRPNLSLLAFAGVGASAIGFLVTLGAIWSDSNDEGTWRAAGVLFVIALALANVAVLISRRRASDGPAVTAVFGMTIAGIAVLTMMLISELSEHGSEDDAFYRVLGIFAVLWVLGMVLLPILRKATRQVEE
jgi:MFS family permease